jgi:hypothetical protein
MWMSTESGIFEVTPYYNALRGSAGHYFPLKSIWGARVPRKVVFFMWTTALGKLLTR